MKAVVVWDFFCHKNENLPLLSFLEWSIGSLWIITVFQLGQVWYNNVIYVWWSLHWSKDYYNRVQIYMSIWVLEQ